VELRDYLTTRREVGPPDECWPWTGAMLKGGHGQVEIAGKCWTAHWLAFFVAYGWLPEQVHHRCENKPCVNPAHLEGLTLVEHQRIHRVRDVCSNGHDMTDPANVWTKGDRRQCRACNRDRQRRYRS
jgi:hypothetical protein